MTPSLRFFLFISILAISFHASARPTGSGSVAGTGSSGFSGLGGTGNTSFGLLGGIVNSTQDSMNQLQARGNTREGGITTSQLLQAYEGALTFTYRFTGTMYAIQFRPSYFYERQDGHGASGSYMYSVTGYTLFPLLRIYPLENDLMKIFLQGGLGYGQVKGSINEGQTNGTDQHVDFGSGAFGTMVGMGAEFIYSNTSTFSVEVDYRYLNYVRNVATSANGTWASNSLTQAQKGQEVEFDSSDFDVNMSGLMFLVGYNFYF
ncbi:MAG: outer membrane protein [Bdellovibrionales bacterium]